MAPSDTMNQPQVFETAHPSQIAASPGARRRPRLFGQYLVDEGAIGARDVEEALALMRLVNSPVGEIAVGEGLLSSDQVQTILDEQRRVDGRFFELAASLGLGGAQLEVLCSDQAVENLRFGDALVEVGAISSTALEDHLRAYDREEHFASLHLPGTPSALARTLADLVPRLARRALGSSLRFSSATPWDARGLDVHATAACGRDGGLALGLSVDHDVAGRLGPRTGDAATSWSRQLAPLLLADFVGLTLSMALRKHGLSSEDITLSPGELPVHGHAFDVAFEHGVGTLVIAEG